MTTPREQEFEEKKRQMNEALGKTVAPVKYELIFDDDDEELALHDIPATTSQQPEPVKKKTKSEGYLARCRCGVANVWEGFDYWFTMGSYKDELQSALDLWRDHDSLSRRMFLASEIDHQTGCGAYGAMRLIRSWSVLIFVPALIACLFPGYIMSGSGEQDTFGKVLLTGVVWLFSYMAILVFFMLSVLLLDIVSDLVLRQRWAVYVKPEKTKPVSVLFWLRNMLISITYGQWWVFSYCVVTQLLMDYAKPILKGAMVSSATMEDGRVFDTFLLGIDKTPWTYVWVWAVLPVTMALVGVFTFIVELLTDVIIAVVARTDRLMITMGQSDAWFVYSPELVRRCKTGVSWRQAADVVFETYMKKVNAESSVKAYELYKEEQTKTEAETAAKQVQ